ncbi:MAG: Na/Pi cotransporter family protein [Bacteroidia bacterium]
MLFASTFAKIETNLLQHLDIWKFLAGLGIFMFGMFLLEEAVKQLSGRTFKRLIKKTTTGKIRSVFSGIFATAVLQSSSAVSLITLAFVGAGVMSMQNAIGVIMGTNVGTTFTGWIVATLGFKLKIEAFSLPLIGIGGLGLIFLSSFPRYLGFSKLIVGLGFLFMGLDYMKLSVEKFANSIDITAFPHYGTWFYVIIGFILTALMQSSSATLAIILTAVNSKVIFFSEGAAMVIGANIGTTVTILLGVIGGVQIKKQVAFSHVIFNVGTGIIAFLILPFFLNLVEWLVPDQNSDVVGIAIFHTLFNVLGVLIFLPFINIMVKWLERMFPVKSDEVTIFINNVSHDLPEAALKALNEETKHLFHETVRLGMMVLRIDNKEMSASQHLVPIELLAKKEKNNPEAQLNQINQLQKEITIYAANFRQDEVESEDAARLHQLIHACMMLSQVSKTIWSVRDNAEELYSSSTDKAREYYDIIKQNHSNFWFNIEAAIIENSASKKGIPDELIQEIEQQYEAFITRVAGALEKGLIKEKHASSLLLINGLLTQSNRQVFNTAQIIVSK